MDFVYSQKKHKDTLFYLILIISIIIGGYFIIYKQFISPPNYYFTAGVKRTWHKGELKKNIDELTKSPQFSQLREYANLLPQRPALKSFIKKVEENQPVGRENPFISPMSSENLP